MKITGIVRKYTGTGRKLGFPTANLDLNRDIPDGLYIGLTTLPERKNLPSLVYVGAPETFDLNNRRLESHILDSPDRDLYGETITVEILNKLRDNIRFENVQDLISQMKKDAEKAREYFKKQ